MSLSGKRATLSVAIAVIFVACDGGNAIAPPLEDLACPPADAGLSAVIDNDSWATCDEETWFERTGLDSIMCFVGFQESNSPSRFRELRWCLRFFEGESPQAFQGTFSDPSDFSEIEYSETRPDESVEFHQDLLGSVTLEIADNNRATGTFEFSFDNGTREIARGRISAVISVID